MWENDLYKCQKMTWKVINTKRRKIKISCSDSHANEKHMMRPGEHRPKSSEKKKMRNTSTPEP